MSRLFNSTTVLITISRACYHFLREENQKSRDRKYFQLDLISLHISSNLSFRQQVPIDMETPVRS